MSLLMCTALENNIFLWRISRRMWFPGKQWVRKPNSLSPAMAPNCWAARHLKAFFNFPIFLLQIQIQMNSATLQSMCGFFNSLLQSVEKSFSLYSHPFPSWGDKSLNDDQGRSNRLQQLSVWNVQVTGSDNEGQVTHHTWHWGEISDLLIHFNCCQHPIAALTVDCQCLAAV